MTFASTDPAYNGLSAPDVPVTVYDAGVTNTPPSLTVPEGGSTSYTIVLDGPPGFLALTTAKGGNRDEHVTVTVGGVAHLFTRANWNLPQTITVNAPAPDGLCGDRTMSIVETVTSDINLNRYMDSGYGGPTSPAPNVDAPDMLVQVTDTDCPTDSQTNRVTPPTLNGSAPQGVTPNGAAPGSDSGDLPPSVDAASGQ